MNKIFMLLLMIVFSIISMLSLYLSDKYLISSILLLLNFFLTFIIVNMNNRVNNLINLQSFFLLGFFVFFLARFASFLLEKSLYSQVFCMNFIFYYCESMPNIIYLILVLNLILISYSLGFVFHHNNNYTAFSSYKISKRKIIIIYILALLSLLLVISNNVNIIIIAITQGYIALYANQAEAYQTPYALLISTFSATSMAVLYSFKRQIRPLFFNIIFSLFIMSMLSVILTGSRSVFVSSLLLLLWHFYGQKSISKIKYLLLLIFCFLTLYTIDIIAALSGARPNQESTGIIHTMAESLYGQGITLMVFNSSINVENYPILGYIKTLLPGIQILFPPFGVTERHEFDWSSFMTYSENREAYQEGYGLGWSIFSDFYILSFKILPVFCLFVYLFSRFTIYISNANSNFKEGLLFICIMSFFGISRASISPLIFTIIIYIIFSLYSGSLRIKKRAVL